MNGICSFVFFLQKLIKSKKCKTNYSKRKKKQRKQNEKNFLKTIQSVCYVPMVESNE